MGHQRSSPVHAFSKGKDCRNHDGFPRLQMLQRVGEFAAAHAATRVLLAPSTRDATAAPVFPTPPLPRPSDKVGSQHRLLAAMTAVASCGLARVLQSRKRAVSAAPPHCTAWGRGGPVLSPRDATDRLFVFRHPAS